MCEQIVHFLLKAPDLKGVFDMVMDIRCRASCEINIFDRKESFLYFHL